MDDFELRLLPAAEDDLADIWVRAPDRAAVNRADALADQLLRRDPVGNGRLVAEGLYRLTLPPLAYYYAVDTDRRLVEVSVIREVRPSSPP
ncbi:MAG: hypothetical protein C0501_05885 [Isosphaera sp.]|nr:hypothetical protein [Isosphaera sp.]